MKKTLVTLIAASVVGAVVLGWLVFQNRSASAPPKTTPPVSNNQNQPDPNKHDFSDVDFSRKMIIHNQQAIEMTEAVLAVSTNQVVREIATKIQQEQKSAEDQYKSWLGEWNETYTNLSDFPEMDGHDMYPTYLGLASATNMATLKAATGSDADRLFISLMIAHHEGAIQDSGVVSDLQYGKLIEFKNKSLTSYKNDIKRLEDLQKGE